MVKTECRRAAPKALAPQPEGRRIVGNRAFVYRTAGQRHGPITRLVSPGDLGQLLKPFIFLDLFDAPPDSFGGFGLHPHSGIATLTVLLQGATRYEDTTGATGVLPQGGLEWMQAGGGVWHTGSALPGQHNRGFQLWVALPPELENAPPRSQYIAPDRIGAVGPARVLLGRLGDVASAVTPPSPMNYFDVQLAPGQQWIYEPAAGHTVAWMAVHAGSIEAGALVRSGELLVFDDSGDAITFTSSDGGAFIFGCAMPHPHDLVMGSYSVHTNAQALRQGEAGIQRIGQDLRAQGRLR